MKHKLSRFLMTLVALFAMTTGAWAQEVLLTTINASNDFKSGSKTFDGITAEITGGSLAYYSGYGWDGNSSEITITISGPNITSVKFYNGETCATDNTEPFTLFVDGVGHSCGVDQGYNWDGDNVTKIEVYGTPAPAGTDLTPDATRKVWTLDAMPAGNVELQVAYYPGMLTLAQAEGGTIALNYEGDALPEGFEKDDDGNIYVADKTEFKVKATPADGFRLASLMFGETDITDQVDADGKATITMPEGNADITLTAQFSDEYDIAFQPANANTIQSGKATVKVGTEQKTLDEEGKLKQVQMGQTVTIEATTGYKFRKVEAKNGITPATALSPALVNDATVVFTFNYKGSITTFTCTSNNGSFTCVAAGHNANELPGSLTLEENNTKLRFDTACTKSYGTIRDMEQTVIEFNIAESTYYFTTKGGGLSSFTVSVNGTDVTDQLTELK